MATFITKITYPITRYKMGRARKRTIGSRHNAALTVKKAYCRYYKWEDIPDEKELEVAKEYALIGNRPQTVIWLFERILFILKQVVALAVILNTAKLFYIELIARSPFSFIVIYFGMDLVESVIKYLGDKLIAKNELIAKMTFEDYKKWSKWDSWK